MDTFLLQINFIPGEDVILQSLARAQPNSVVRSLRFPFFFFVRCSLTRRLIRSPFQIAGFWQSGNAGTRRSPTRSLTRSLASKQGQMTVTQHWRNSPPKFPTHVTFRVKLTMRRIKSYCDSLFVPCQPQLY